MSLVKGDTVKLEFGEALMCHKAAIYLIKMAHYEADQPQRYNRGLNLHEYIAEYAETVGAEMAVARYFDLPFDAFESKRKIKADVGENLEVKWTHWHDGQLIIHEYDRNSDIAILVTGYYPFYRLAGWIPVVMAKKDKYRHHNQPNWWISQHNLMPIDTLIRSSYGASISNLPKVQEGNQARDI